ncbi:MAG: DUF2909 domain-containing protein [Thiolinea sp.]
MLLFKLIIVILLLFVIGTLFTALYQLNQNKGNSCRVVRTLALRIGLSIFIFILLWVGMYFGLITPHGVYS